MSRTEERDWRSAAVRLFVVVVAALLWVPPVAVAAEEEQQLGQEGAIWNLGTQVSGRSYPTTVSAFNESCSGKRDFKVTVEGEAAGFLRITGPTVLEKIKRGESRATDAVLDLVGVAPGQYNEGTVKVSCLNCAARCRQDYTVIQVHLTVVEPEQGTEPTADETAGTAPSTRKAFTDSEGTGWSYCSGKCTKVVEKIRRADGTTSNVVRVRRGSCDAACSCVLFKLDGGKIIKKLEVTEDKGYVDIGQDSGKDFSVRCCKEG